MHSTWEVSYVAFNCQLLVQGKNQCTSTSTSIGLDDDRFEPTLVWHTLESIHLSLLNLSRCSVLLPEMDTGRESMSTYVRTYVPYSYTDKIDTHAGRV